MHARASPTAAWGQKEPAAFDRLLLRQQALEIGSDLRRLRAEDGQQRDAFFGRKIERLFEIGTDSFPPGGTESRHAALGCWYKPTRT
jgi:hypothetical protein